MKHDPQTHRETFDENELETAPIELPSLKGRDFSQLALDELYQMSQELTLAPETTQPEVKGQLQPEERKSSSRGRFLKLALITAVSATVILTILLGCAAAFRHGTEKTPKNAAADYTVNGSNVLNLATASDPETELEPLPDLFVAAYEEISEELEEASSTQKKMPEETDEEPIYASAQLQRTTSPSLMPDETLTEEPVDLYVSRTVSDTFFVPPPQEIEALLTETYLPETASAGPAFTEEEIMQVENAPAEEANIWHTVVLQFYEKEAIVCSTPSVTLGELLANLEIQLDDAERTHVDMSYLIVEDCDISIDMVETKTVRREEKLPAETEYRDSQTIPRGVEAVISYGTDGILVREYEQKYVNGELVSEDLIQEYTAQAAVNTVIERGVGGTFTGGDGVTYSYSYYVDVKATTYTGGGITATGLPADESVIAVDPDVIPLRSKVYVTGSYGDFGVRIAADVGGGIKNKIIDVYLEETNPYFANFGWRNMRVYILD